MVVFEDHPLTALLLLAFLIRRLLSCWLQSGHVLICQQWYWSIIGKGVQMAQSFMYDKTIDCELWQMCVVDKNKNELCIVIQVRMEELLRSGRISPSGATGQEAGSGGLLGRRNQGPEAGGPGTPGGASAAGGGGGGAGPIAHLSQWQRENLSAQLQIQQLSAQVGCQG